MADINQTAAWVTARLQEVGNATNEGQHMLITSNNIGNYVAKNVSGIVAVANGGTGSSNAQDARANLGITPQNIGALPVTGGTVDGDVVVNGDIVAAEGAINGPLSVTGDETVGGALEVGGAFKATVFSQHTVIPMANGGTGANTLADAKTNLEIPTVTDTYDPDSSEGMSGKAVAYGIGELGLSVEDGLLCVTYEKEDPEI